MGGCSTQPFTILLSPPRQILQEGVESSLRQLLIEAFVSAGRVDNITMVMGLHPQYLSSFWKTQYLLLRMDGPLPYHKRHYIAIMVRMGVPWGYVWSHHLRGVFAWRQEGSWDPRDAPPPPSQSVVPEAWKPLWGWSCGAHLGYPSTPLPSRAPEDRH